MCNRKYLIYFESFRVGFEFISSSVRVSLDHILWHGLEFELILSRFGKIMSNIIRVNMI